MRSLKLFLDIQRVKKCFFTSGVGLPVAEHLRDTAGPGWSVCSMKLYKSTGGASDRKGKKK